MARVFVIRPFGPKKGSAGKQVDFERVDRELILPVLDAVKLGGGTTGEIIESGNIREDMFALIVEADLVIADITVHNAKCFLRARSPACRAQKAFGPDQGGAGGR